MLDELDSENNIAAKHRKERKELQSKIQSLKKGASKGDKKKKKEVLDEIAKIENELTKRHAEELNDFNNARNQNQIGDDLSADDVLDSVNTLKLSESNESNSEDKTKQNENRVSKAQRRRNKKAQKEKEKEAEIAAEQKLHKNGPRMKEEKALKEILKKRGLKIYSIPSDGDCLYNAILHQISLHDLKSVDTKFIFNQNDQIKYLRNETAKYIETHKDILIYYMTSQNSGDLMTNEEFATYCNQIRDTSAWGGQIEIRALANILKTRIEVLQASGPPTIQECEELDNYSGPTLIITYHRHMYSLGEHYNSTIPLEYEDESLDDLGEDEEEES